MSEFMPEPTQILETMEDVRKYIANPRKNDFKIKSLWLIEVIGEIANTGKFPYNADVLLLAEEKLGLPKKTYAEASKEGTPLSMLVYNAQRFRRSDKLKADGYVPCTQEFLERVGKGGRIVVHNDEIFKIYVNGENQKATSDVYIL